MKKMVVLFVAGILIMICSVILIKVISKDSKDFLGA